MDKSTKQTVDRNDDRKKIHNIVASAILAPAMRYIKSEYMVFIRGYLRLKEKDDELFILAEREARKAIERVLLTETNTNNEEKESRFDIPDLKVLENQITEYVKERQGELGFIPTYDPDGDTILTFIYEDCLFRAEEYMVKAVRVNEKEKLQIAYDLQKVKYSIDTLSELEDCDWWDIDHENIYYEQTILNIAYNIESYENL